MTTPSKQTALLGAITAAELLRRPVREWTLNELSSAERIQRWLSSQEHRTQHTIETLAALQHRHKLATERLTIGERGLRARKSGLRAGPARRLLSRALRGAC